MALWICLLPAKEKHRLRSISLLITSLIASFLDNLLRKSSNTKEKTSPTLSSWSNIFTRKPPSPTLETVKPQQGDEATAELVAQLELEGRSEAEIALHLAHIHDVHTTPEVPPSKQTTNVFTQFFRDVQIAFKEEFLMEVPHYVYSEFEADLSRLTVSVSAGPFYGAPPADTDLTYEELASLEPVYVGSQCINNLPICKHDGTPLPGDQTSCPVCLCEFAEGEELKSLPCIHFYHKECIDTWLMVGHTCPLCKTLIE